MRAIIAWTAVLVAGCGSQPPDFDYLDHSDELAYFADAFEEAELQLQAEGACDETEFERGWFKSTEEMGEPTFFIYCGGYTAADRIFLNADAGQTYRHSSSTPRAQAALGP
jgi:hypothetical protein